MGERRNPRWSDELLELCVPERFSVDVASLDVAEKLFEASFSVEEVQAVLHRLRPKLAMVVQRAAKMAANQLKGTLKYLSDDRTADEWLEMLDDDLTDTLNYIDLLKAELAEQDVEQTSRDCAPGCQEHLTCAKNRSLREEFG